MCYVLHYVVKSIRGCFSISFSLHKFIQIAWILVHMATPHPFQFCFHPTPVTLHMLSMNSRGWFNKMENGLACRTTVSKEQQLKVRTYGRVTGRFRE